MASLTTCLVPLRRAFVITSDCLDCAEIGQACDTCAFVIVRVKWRVVHGCEPPYRLWSAASRWGGRHVLRQVKRQGWRHDVVIVRAPRV